MPKPTPDWLPIILKRFGMTPYQRTMYEVRWSEEVREVCFGEEQTRFPEHPNRWLLMKFLPWEDYGEWNEAAFGPKPMGGEYELCYVIEVDKEFVSLDQYGAETLALLIQCIEREKLIPKSEKLRLKREKLHKAEEARHQRFSDIYDDAQNAFSEAAVSGIPGKKKPEDTRIVTLDQLSPRLRQQIATRAGQIRQIN